MSLIKEESRKVVFLCRLYFFCITFFLRSSSIFHFWGVVFHFFVRLFSIFFNIFFLRSSSFFFWRSSSISYFCLGRLPFNQAQMSPYTNFQAPRTSLSGRIKIGQKSVFLLFIQCEYKASQASLWLQPRLGLCMSNSGILQ